MNRSFRPILLTGSHRSGTTWAGHILSASREVGYVMEPFNDVNRRPGVFGKTFGCFFPYITEENQAAFLPFFHKTLTFQYSLIRGLSSIRSWREAGRLVRDCTNFWRYRLGHKRPLIKDPNALFMTEWLARTFDIQVVILIRHPAAFASSLMKLDWAHPFSDFLKQPRLMQDMLLPFSDEIREYAQKEKPLIDQAILLWKIIHSTIARYQADHPDWLFVRHEDLSANPAGEFRNLCEALILPFDSRIRQRIKRLCESSNPADATSKAIAVSSTKSIRRDSKANIMNWKRRLSASQVVYIRDRVEPLSSQFYSPNTW